MPNGKRKPIYYAVDQSKLDIVNSVILPHWEEYCLRHWMDDKPDSNHSRETAVKRFLDDVAYLLLRDDSEGTLTNYKIRAVGSMEIDVSSCPAVYEDIFYGSSAIPHAFNDDGVFEILLEDLDAKAPTKKDRAKPRKRIVTRFEKIERLRKTRGDCEIVFCAVDTCGAFVHMEQTYRIDEGAQQYHGRETKEGQYYDMDRVMVVDTVDGERIFFDQNADPLEDLVHPE